MRLTQYTDFSMRVLIYLGIRGHELATIQDISDAYGISRNHLMKVVQQLAHEGYVEAIRGQGGGLRLLCPANEIKLGKLVEDMEPDLALVECYRADNKCVITPACGLPGMLNQALRAFIGELNEYTIADLLPCSSPSRLGQLLKIDEPVS